MDENQMGSGSCTMVKVMNDDALLKPEYKLAALWCQIMGRLWLRW